MLTIRDSQLHLFAEADRLDLRQTVVDILRYRYAAVLAQSPAVYIEDIARRTVDACGAGGLERRGDAIEFAEAIVCNDAHPMAPDALDAKVRVVMRERRSRELFNRLWALSDARSGASDEVGASEEET